MGKLTKAQRRALELMRDAGSIHPCSACGMPGTYVALRNRGLAYRVGLNGPYNITEAGRQALSEGEQNG